MAKINKDLPKMTKTMSLSSDSSDDDILVRSAKKKKIKRSSATPRQTKENDALGRVLKEKNEKPIKKYNIYNTELGKFYSKRKRVNKIVPSSPVLDVDQKETPEINKSKSTLASKKSKVIFSVNDANPMQTRQQSGKSEITLASSLEDFDFEEIIPVPSPIKPNEKIFLRSLDDNMNFFDDVIELDEDNVADESINEAVTVRISCAMKCEKFQMKPDQEFRTILEDLSKILGVPSSDITLYLGFDVINLSDTPLSRNVRPLDEIICSTSVGSRQSTINLVKSVDSSVIILQLQSNLEKKKNTFKCHKNKPLRVLVEDFAAYKDIDVKRVNLKLDGDLVNLDETAAEYDLENGDCIDVLVK